MSRLGRRFFCPGCHGYLACVFIASISILCGVDNTVHTHLCELLLKIESIFLRAPACIAQVAD